MSIENCAIISLEMSKTLEKENSELRESLNTFIEITEDYNQRWRGLDHFGKLQFLNNWLNHSASAEKLLGIK